MRRRRRFRTKSPIGSASSISTRACGSRPGCYRISNRNSTPRWRSWFSTTGTGRYSPRVRSRDGHLEIERQHWGFRSGAADHDLAVFCLFLIAEETVAMIGNPLDHPCFAGATDAFRAGKGNVDAIVEQNVQDGLPGRHGDGASAAMQLHVKAPIRDHLLRHRGLPLAECWLQRIAEIGTKLCRHMPAAEFHP